MAARFEAVRRAVAAAMAETGTPGAVVALSGDHTTDVAALGETSVENPLAVTAGTLFEIGSITQASLDEMKRRRSSAAAQASMATAASSAFGSAAGCFHASPEGTPARALATYAALAANAAHIHPACDGESASRSR